ncbi:MAG: ABC transporter ATP-binding protein, partial [Tannerellaceae bacterium]|nr:ABC transporter ATP-binding protein [Tannerellaceae bacterium]
MSIPAVSISNLSKTYKGSSRPALDSLSITINQGEIYGLLGPNGAGKTTLIHILCGLRTADSGSARIFDLPIPSRLGSVKPQIGLVPQDIALYPSLTVKENLNIFGGIYGMKRSELGPLISSMLLRFGLEAQERKPLHACSGGMKRCVNLIVGILHRPRLLILDEPTVGIDVQSRQLILNNLR